jgi:hypothetical protein
MRRTGRPWSPDGKQIDYSFLNDLRVMNADGSHSRVLTEGGEPNWLDTCRAGRPVVRGKRLD